MTDSSNQNPTNPTNSYSMLIAKRESKIAKAQEHANYLLASFMPYTEWSFTWNNNIHSLGLCNYGKREISLSKKWTLATSWAEVDDTLRHEVAHAIAGYAAGHGIKWQRIAETVGAKPETTYKGTVLTRDVHTAKYEMIDTTTGKLLKSYYRKPTVKTYQRVKGMFIRGRRKETIGKLVIKPVDLIKELDL